MAENIFKDIPDDLTEEILEIILETKEIRIERIVSKGHSSSKDFWYDQEKNEYVILLKGRAGVAFKDREDTVILEPGDYIDIPAHVKHRVEWTAKEEHTVWLAVYY